MVRPGPRNNPLTILAAFVLSLSAGSLPAQEFTTLKGHGGPIMGIAVSQDGEVATASFDNSVGIWRDGVPAWLEGHDAAVTAIAFGPDGMLVTGGDDYSVRIWGDAPRVLGRHAGKVSGLAVSPDGDWIASSSWDGSVRLWSADGARHRLLAEPGAGVNDVAFDLAGQHLFIGTSDGLLLKYPLGGGSPEPLARHGFGVNRLAVGDGWIVYGAVDGGTRVIDSKTGALVADFTLDRRPILALSYHEPTGQIAIGDGQGYIMMLDTLAWRIARDFRATLHGPVWALDFSADGAVIHAGGLDDVVYGWPVASLDKFDPAIGAQRSFLRDAASMPNGERQFMRKCSICHALEPGESRKAGPTLYGLFGRGAGDIPGYAYSQTLAGSKIVWTEETVNQLFDEGPDHYIPGSKMPMQVIADAEDRLDLIDYLRQATKGE